MRFLILLILLFQGTVSAQFSGNTITGFEEIYELQSERLLTGPALSGSLKMGINSDGMVYLLDMAQNKVFVYDQNLMYQFSFGEKGKGPGEFEGAADLYIAENNDVLILDSRLHRVSLFSPSGELINTLPVHDRAIDMAIFNDMLCTHAGGVVPRGGKAAVNCFDMKTGAQKKTFTEKSQVIGDRPIAFSNATFHLIQKTPEKLIILQHPLDGTIYVYDKNEQLKHKFIIDNDQFSQPEFPQNFNFVRDKFSDYVSSTISGIHIANTMILVVLIGFETGTKYLDIYSLEGKKLIEQSLNMDRIWPIYADVDGNLYSISYADDEQNLNLKKYTLKK